MPILMTLAQVDPSYGLLKGYGPLAFGCVAVLVLIAAFSAVWIKIISPSVKDMREIAAKQSETAVSTAEAAKSAKDAAEDARSTAMILKSLIERYPVSMPTLRHPTAAHGETR